MATQTQPTPAPAEPLIVKAEEKTQADLPILVANCPKCGKQIALSGPGKVGCCVLLEFVKA